MAASAHARQWMIAGLGNPGTKYAETRHNVGFMVAERVAARCGICLNQSKFKARFGRGSWGDVAVLIAEPMDYMNRSGPPLRSLAGYFDLPLEHMLVIHDDIDIEKGQIKIKEKGGHGGHNGIRSIMEAFGSGDFPRLRIGTGRPGPPMDVTDYVLGRFTAEEKRFFAPVLENAEHAVITIIENGLAAAMNRYNQKNSV